MRNNENRVRRLDGRNETTSQGQRSDLVKFAYEEETGEPPAFWSVERGQGLGAWVIACAQGVCLVTMKANAKFVSTYWLQ
jgi:hypothetical protein